MVGEAHLLSRLKERDEEAFRELVRLHHGAMVGLARSFVGSAATAEEVAQETWLAVLKGLDGFQERSSLKTWIFSILANRARTRAVRDGRMVLFSEVGDPAAGEDAVDPSRFQPSGLWNDPPAPWAGITPERLAASAELGGLLRRAIDDLPEALRAVVLLRDVEGCSAEEACHVLGVSETNQRVLLHRGRSRLRSILEGALSRPKAKRG